MHFPLTLASENGHFTATVLSAPHLRVEAATRLEAVAQLKALVAERVQRGEVDLEKLQLPGLVGLAGKYADDPTLLDICDEAYRDRDAEIDE